MRVLVFTLALLSSVLVASEAKIIQRCHLAKELNDLGLSQYLGFTLGDWLCTVFHESGFNTDPPVSPTRRKAYGLFRINNSDWCSDGVQPSKNLCNISCSKLIDDDIKDDILCAKKIIKQNGHLKAWPRWAKRCRGKDLSVYVKSCKF